MTKNCLICKNKVGIKKLTLKDGYICSSCMKESGWGSWGFTSAVAFSWAKHHTFDDFNKLLKEGGNAKSVIKEATDPSDVQGKSFHDIALEGNIQKAQEKINSLNLPNKIKQQLLNSESFDFFGVKKELLYLPKVVNSDNEKISYLCSGMLDSHTWLIVCTNQRIIFLNKNMIYGMQQQNIPLEAINAITFSQKLLLGSISITNGATVTTIDSINKMAAPIMASKIQNAVRNFKNNNSISSDTDLDDLRKLKSLLDDGIITQEEFDSKKKQILDL